MEVKLCALTEASEPVGITLAESEGVFMVTAVAPLSVAARSAQVAVGLVVMEINGNVPTSIAALSGTVAKPTVMHVQFARPRPQIPYHGSARKGIHKSVQYRMTDEQQAWLESNVFKDGDRVYGMRDKAAFTAMKAAFVDRIRTDTMTPVWLEQSQIAAWLVKQVKEEKDKRKVERAKARSGGEDAEEPASKRPKKGKRAGKAPAKGKGKGKAGKAPAKRRRAGQISRMEEDGEESDSDAMEESDDEESDNE